MLTNHTEPLTQWGPEGRAITVYDFATNAIIPRNIACPEHIGRRFNLRERGRFIDNIIVSVLSRAVFPSLYALRYRIDRRTTICLLDPGLGMMERLNEVLFNDPASRPNYILCHSDHKLTRHSCHKYSLRHKPGKLLLYAVPREADSDLDLETSQALSNQHIQHLIQLFSTARDLDAVGLKWPVFQRQKLPDMIFQSLGDTISVILGCRFDQIRRNKHAMELWHYMLQETLQIITSLPEYQDEPELLDYFTRETFPKKLRRKLARRDNQYSKWISMVRRGWLPPVDFVNGYFVKRAQELGLNHSQNSLAISLVKARHEGRRDELNANIPFGLMPYIQDLDMIGGGQEKHDPNVDVELEL